MHFPFVSMGLLAFVGFEGLQRDWLPELSATATTVDRYSGSAEELRRLVFVAFNMCCIRSKNISTSFGFPVTLEFRGYLASACHVVTIFTVNSCPITSLQ